MESRLDRWNSEVEKTRYFVAEMEKIGKGGIKQLGVKPKLHDVVYFETPVFYEISQKDHAKGYFLAKELRKRGIVGPQDGKTKGFKVSVYGLDVKEIDYIIQAFKDIIDGK